MKAIITDHGFPNVDQEEALLGQAGVELKVVQCKTADEVVKNCGDGDALLVQWAPITAEVIAKLSRCKVIVRYGIGVDNVDLKAAAARGIPVCNIPDYCIDEVADHAMALALSLGRQISQTDSVVRGGTWKILPPHSFPAFRKTLFATAGFGRIARAVLERARPFGFILGGYDPFVDEAVFAAAHIRKLTKEELVEKAGLISLHLPLTPQTMHFIGPEQLNGMRRDAIVVNTARGGLIDTSALALALEEGKIAGAGIDVFEQEPLPADHPLRRAPNVLLTSHTAWYSGGSIPLLQRKAAEEVLRGLRGEQLINAVNGVKLRD